MPMGIGVLYLRLNVLEQNLQLYGLSPESKISQSDTSTSRSNKHCTYVAADVVADVPFVGISCHTDCRSIGFEPPL